MSTLRKALTVLTMLLLLLGLSACPEPQNNSNSSNQTNTANNSNANNAANSNAANANTANSNTGSTEKASYCSYGVTTSDCEFIRPSENVCFLCTPGTNCPNRVGEKVKVGYQGHECNIKLGERNGDCGACSGKKVVKLD